MPSQTEQVLEGLRAALETVPGAVVQRNSVPPENIPDGGLMIVRRARRGGARRNL